MFQEAPELRIAGGIRYAAMKRKILIDRVLAEGRDGFAGRFLTARGLHWATALLHDTDQTLEAAE